MKKQTDREETDEKEEPGVSLSFSHMTFPLGCGLNGETEKDKGGERGREREGNWVVNEMSDEEYHSISEQRSRRKTEL